MSKVVIITGGGTGGHLKIAMFLYLNSKKEVLKLFL